MPGPPSQSSPELFHCPTCGAALPVPDENSSVRCSYCGSTVLVPPEYRQQKQPDPSGAKQPVVIQISGSAEPQSIDLSGATRRRSRSIAVVIGVLAVICIAMGVVSTVLATAGVFTTASVVNLSIKQVATLPAVSTEKALVQLPATPSANPDYSFELQFGAKGSGPGQFDDSRYLAVDTNGNI